MTRTTPRKPRQPLDPTEIEIIRRMRADGHTIKFVAGALGRDIKTIRRYSPGRIGKVPVAPIREAFLASGISAAEVARRLGWWQTCRGYEIADPARVRRTLGINADINGAGYRSYRQTTDAETVQLIAEAIGISPWAVLPDDDEEAA